jgi:hypothetical protein
MPYEVPGDRTPATRHRPESPNQSGKEQKTLMKKTSSPCGSCAILSGALVIKGSEEPQGARAGPCGRRATPLL